MQIFGVLVLRYKSQFCNFFIYKTKVARNPSLVTRINSCSNTRLVVSPMTSKCFIKCDIRKCIKTVVSVQVSSVAITLLSRGRTNLPETHELSLFQQCFSRKSHLLHRSFDKNYVFIKLVKCCNVTNVKTKILFTTILNNFLAT